MFKRIRNLLFGLTKQELEQANVDVVIALYKIRNDKKQIEIAKKLCLLMEIK